MTERIELKKTMKIFNRNLLSGIIPFLLSLLLCFFSGLEFKKMHREDAIYPAKGLNRKCKLSSYMPSLKNSPGDTDVYIFQGQEKGGNLLILGGTHPNEPSGFLTAVIFTENIHVLKGKVIIIPQANRSGFTHSDPQEANPQRFSLPTSKERRWFRFGSRLTNPVHQWPDPTVYINPAGQRTSGNESRNLNRCYPGKREGSLTEKVAFGIIELIREEKIDLAFDLHEAAPEYPVVNAIVFHENAAELAALALMELQMEGREFRLESSPPKLRGLSHREWGDHTEAMAVLLETANPAQGRLKGRTSSSLIKDGKDKNYVRAAQIGRLFVPYDRQGIPLDSRVARHIAAVNAHLSSLKKLDPDKDIEWERIPSPARVEKDGIGAFLAAEK